MQADGSTDAANGKFRIDFANTGEAGACLQVRSGNTADGPRTYTVEAGKSLSDTWSVDAQGRYDLSVYGPNGFMRAFKGAVPSRRRPTSTSTSATTATITTSCCASPTSGASPPG